MKKVLQLLVLVMVSAGLLISSSEAASMKGVTLNDTTTLAGQKLQLNGIGLRKKFFLSIYVTGLYLPKKTSSATEAITADVPKEIVMAFVYHKVGKEKIIEGWNEGFFNNSQEKLSELKAGIDQFNGYFTNDLVKGDRIDLFYQPEVGTSVTINNKKLGVIPGKDFMQALWAIWLGDNPADSKLKGQLLGK
ncbi:MAG: hypothetical protein GWP07_07015 [Xanthomonadaceae bacterium]|nr:hypothetical protein [Xanthomonadaceae bacterium]